MLARFGPELTSIAYEEIEKKVRGEAKGEWGRSGMLKELRGWGRGVVGGWWEGFYAGEFDASLLRRDTKWRLVGSEQADQGCSTHRRKDGRTSESSPWSKLILSFASPIVSTGQDNIDQTMKPIHSRLDYHVCKTMSDLRYVASFSFLLLLVPRFR